MDITEHRLCFRVDIYFCNRILYRPEAVCWLLVRVGGDRLTEYPWLHVLNVSPGAVVRRRLDRQHPCRMAQSTGSYYHRPNH